ncbi:MAG: hypothetical protein ABIR84_10275, partial [Candidatus Nitrotoga sp.]
MNIIQIVRKIVIGVLLMHFLVACAKPPAAGMKSGGEGASIALPDASMDASSLSNAALGDDPLTSASGVTIYTGSG